MGRNGRSVSRRLSLRWFEPNTCHQGKHQLRDATASLISFRATQPDATGSRCLPLVVGYTWDSLKGLDALAAQLSLDLICLRLLARRREMVAQALNDQTRLGA